MGLLFRAILFLGTSLFRYHLVFDLQIPLFDWALIIPSSRSAFPFP